MPDHGQWQGERRRFRGASAPSAPNLVSLSMRGEDYIEVILSASYIRIIRFEKVELNEC